MQEKEGKKKVTPEVILSSVSYTITREGEKRTSKIQLVELFGFNSLRDCRPVASSYQVLSGGPFPCLASRVGGYYYFLETCRQGTQLV